jgi:phosphoglycolate phosphatase
MNGAYLLRNIFFDLDGTLLDPRVGITGCIRHALLRMGQASPNEYELTAFIGPPLRETFKRLLNSDNKSLIEQAVSYYRERYSTQGIYENVVYPGIYDLLRSLKQDSFKLYVVTTKPKIYADIIIQHFDFIWFEGVFGTGMDGTYDNKTDLVRHALEIQKLRPEETVMIGDRREDIIAGLNNGIKTIGVTYGYGSRDEIVASNPDMICHTIQDIGNAIRIDFNNK